MNLKLEGKTAFISGSTGGIGFETARLLLAEGAHVIINGRHEAGLKEALKKLRSEAQFDQVAGLLADFAQVEEVDRLLGQLPEINILINNVGTYASQSFFATSDDDWAHQYEVNVMSGVRLSRALLPQMLDKNWGRILFISSECATLVPADLIAYSATKAAILAISRGLAQLTAGTRVSVNTIIPGSTYTEGAQMFLENLATSRKQTVQEAEKDFFAQERSASLLQRFAQVSEIAQTIVYYASPLSSASNGASVKVDGGSMGGIL